MYEDLEIKELRPGHQVSGVYRGEKFHLIDDPDGPIEIGRVFLDTEDGPVAVSGDGSVLAQVRALNLTDGDHIIITRPTESVYHVVREVPDSEADRQPGA